MQTEHLSQQGIFALVLFAQFLAQVFVSMEPDARVSALRGENLGWILHHHTKPL